MSRMASVAQTLLQPSLISASLETPTPRHARAACEDLHKLDLKQLRRFCHQKLDHCLSWLPKCDVSACEQSYIQPPESVFLNIRLVGLDRPGRLDIDRSPCGLRLPRWRSAMNTQRPIPPFQPSLSCCMTLLPPHHLRRTGTWKFHPCPMYLPVALVVSASICTEKLTQWHVLNKLFVPVQSTRQPQHSLGRQ